MSSKNQYTEGTENNGTHREFLLDNSNSLIGNKWGKENNKFFRDFGSSPCLPSTKNEDQLIAYPQDKQDPNPRTIRNS
jgi:hypothetical protein